MKIITRGEARARGLKRFFTGAPCKHGHISEWYVGVPVCIACLKLRRRAGGSSARSVARKRRQRALRTARLDASYKALRSLGVQFAQTPEQPEPPQPIVMSGKDARALGFSRYFTGRPCVHGHISERRARDGECCKCRAIQAHKKRSSRGDRTGQKRRLNQSKRAAYRTIRELGINTGAVDANAT